MGRGVVRIVAEQLFDGQPCIGGFSVLEQQATQRLQRLQVVRKLRHGLFEFPPGGGDIAARGRYPAPQNHPLIPQRVLRAAGFIPGAGIVGERNAAPSGSVNFVSCPDPL